jgi:hypothetical protein
MVMVSMTLKKLVSSGQGCLVASISIKSQTSDAVHSWRASVVGSLSSISWAVSAVSGLGENPVIFHKLKDLHSLLVIGTGEAILLRGITCFTLFNQNINKIY